MLPRKWNTRCGTLHIQQRISESTETQLHRRMHHVLGGAGLSRRRGNDTSAAVKLSGGELILLDLKSSLSLSACEGGGSSVASNEL